MNNIVYGFFMFWGLMFGGIPLGLYLSGEANLFDQPFLLIFVVIGCIVFLIGLRGILKNIKYKIIRKKGIKSIGVFIDRACGVTVNGTPMYYIKFSFVNEQGTSIEFKTPSIYTVRQAEFYEKLGRFEIKYLNKVAVITQPVDYRLIDKINEHEENRNSTLFNPENRPTIKNGYYYCDYCGNEQEKPGKCKSCGAKVTSKNFRQSR